MLAVLTWDFFNKSKKKMGWGKSIGLVALSLVIIQLLGIHPGIVIAGILIYSLTRKEKADAEQQLPQKGVSL
jgi:chromate transporter